MARSVASSSAELASSRNSQSGLTSSARAKDSRCCSPGDITIDQLPVSSSRSAKWPSWQAAQHGLADLGVAVRLRLVGVAQGLLQGADREYGFCGRNRILRPRGMRICTASERPQPGQDAKQRGLAAARRPLDHHPLARGDDEIDIVAACTSPVRQRPPRHRPASTPAAAPARRRSPLVACAACLVAAIASEKPVSRSTVAFQGASVSKLLTNQDSELCTCPKALEVCMTHAQLDLAGEVARGLRPGTGRSPAPGRKMRSARSAAWSEFM